MIFNFSSFSELFGSTMILFHYFFFISIYTHIYDHRSRVFSFRNKEIQPWINFSIYQGSSVRWM